ncbi:MAG: conjugal transfer protein TraF [Gemmatimonadetes bacterium]|uniref:Conjugal transfer protein TraF n=1 Tax=Candidatus Kutchimonas denitrificans TaxID=3056748 RepID=A0AAE5C9K3_9BACT|nr:conjugal transfer protein TraF [Gemmatimonadota bacterium]NIR75571.1 conjugal transfer protein TraF [Candidatus Kutchimonas denitrificans]NIS01885.1 conjugal transfer protein TraF [Gemmatimonadota bacterium]NIT67666.1 conjugal transfer protein TraF [Gemmatimonadota bacterium]NIU53540.1 hypothetical protein [Gemmatimonadota bacterium]
MSNTDFKVTTIVLALLACSPGVAGAQMAAPSARSAGLADSYVGRARGYESPFWNPANLGLSDRPGWSIGLAGANAYLDNNSLSYGQIEDLYGEYLDDATKSELLAEIRGVDGDGMLELSADLGATGMAFSIWRFAFGVGATGSTALAVSPDAAELILFGNMGEDGTGRDFTLDGSHGDGWGLSSVYVSYAQPFTIPALDYLDMKFSIGATVKYGVAHGLYRAADQGTALTYDPLVLDVDAEVLNSTEFNAGSVWAADLGAAMEWGSLVAGISVIDAFSNIQWDEEAFELKRYTAHADFDSATSTDTTLAFSELTLADQERVSEYLQGADVPKKLRLGAAWRMGSMLSLSADYLELLGGSLNARWERQLSAGAELRLLSVVPLRAGLATDFNSLAVTGGFGLYAGPVHLDFAAGRWGIGAGDGVALALSLSVWPGTGY